VQHSESSTPTSFEDFIYSEATNHHQPLPKPLPQHLPKHLPKYLPKHLPKRLSYQPRRTTQGTSNPLLADFEIKSVYFHSVTLLLIKKNQSCPFDYIKVPLEAEEYLAHTRLLAAASQTKVNIAKDKAIQRRLQEYRLLLKIGESGGDISNLDLHTALTLARLARQTLASEYDLALSKLDACRQDLVVLQDAVDEALVFLTDADHQVAQIFSLLDRARLGIPRHPVFTTFPNTPFERPDHLFCDNMQEEEERGECSSSSDDSFDSCNSGGGSPI
jgi:hypothetical protein